MNKLLCDDKLTTRCVSRVVCDVDDVEEEGSGRRRRRECRTKNKNPTQRYGEKSQKHVITNYSPLGNLAQWKITI